MRKILGILGWADVVWTRDYDGDIRLRIVRRCNGILWVCGILPSRRSRLLIDGSLVPFPGESSVYMEKWKSYRVRPKFTAQLQLQLVPVDRWDTL